MHPQALYAITLCQRRGELFERSIGIGECLAALLYGQGLKDANSASVLVVLNTDKQAQRLSLPALSGKRWALHPVHLSPTAADKRVREASLDAQTGELLVPGRTAMVWVVK